MDSTPAGNIPDSKKLLEIIKVQTQIAQAPLDLTNVMEVVTQTAARLTFADGAVVELADGADMVYRSAIGIASGQLGLRIPRAGSLSGLCVERGELLFCEDSETDERVNRESCRAVGLRSMIVVPLRYKTDIVGVLKVMKRIAGGFSRSDIETLNLVSGFIGAHLAQSVQYQSRVEETAELLRIATHDALTGIHNRSAFYDSLRQSMSAARRYSEQLGVAVLDMDGLKSINDTYGHGAGDLALRSLADQLRRNARVSDVVARLGGDEFGVLLPRLESRASAVGMGCRLSESFLESVSFQGVSLPIRASVGVAVFPDDGDNPDQLLRVADAAMYEMKRARKAERK